MNVFIKSAKRVLAESQNYISYNRKKQGAILYDEIRNMSLSAGEMLRARFYGKTPKGADLENVLFYNIGSGCFTKLIQNGVIFEEMLKNDFELLVNTGMIANDSCVYEYNLGVQSISWGSPIATCICGEILGKTVSETWREIKNAGWKICVSNPLPTRIYLDIKITACKGELTIDRIKHMLDGIISSLHHYTNFTQQEEFFLTQLLNCSSQELTSKTILDERKFVSIKPSNSNLKWNPADDREVLKGCRINLEDGTKKKTEITVFS